MHVPLSFWHGGQKRIHQHWVAENLCLPFVNPVRGYVHGMFLGQVFGRSWSSPSTARSKPGLVYIKAGLAERHKSPDLNVPALALHVAETWHMLTFPGKTWLEKHKKGRRQRAVSASESSSGLSGLWGQLFALQTKQGRDSACKMLVIFLVVCSIAPFILPR